MEIFYCVLAPNKWIDFISVPFKQFWRRDTLSTSSEIDINLMPQTPIYGKSTLAQDWWLQAASHYPSYIYPDLCRHVVF